MQAAIRAALGPLQAYHALDAISSSETWLPVAQVLAPGSVLSAVSGAHTYNDPEIPEGVQVKYTYVGAVHEGEYKEGMPKQPDLGTVSGMKAFAGELFGWLGRGGVEGHPWRVVPGGLEGVGQGLRMLKKGEARGKKFVYRIMETEGQGG